MTCDSQPFELSSTSKVPFSLEYFYQCYERVYKRRNHETLNGNNPDLIGIFGIFIANFVNVKFDNTLISLFKFDSVFKLPFTDNSNHIASPEIIEAFKKFTLNTTSKNYQIALRDLLNEAIEARQLQFNETFNELSKIGESALLQMIEVKETKVIAETKEIGPDPNVRFRIINHIIVHIFRLKNH